MGMSPLLRWGLVFVACPLPLSDEDKEGLVRVAAQAWFEDQPRIPFDWSGCQGVLTASSEVVSLGTFVGQSFEAEVHVPSGSATVRFLVTEKQLQLAAPVAEA